MVACTVCGAGVREELSRCATCGALLDNPGGSFVPLATVAPAPAGVVPSREVVRRPPPTRAVVAVLVAFALACTVAALVVAPRLYPQVDPQKFVGSWVYVSGASGSIDIARSGRSFTIAFVRTDGTQQRVPGTVSNGKLVSKSAALRLSDAASQRAVARVRSLTFVYQQDRDRLVMTAHTTSRIVATVELRRSGPVAQ